MKPCGTPDFFPISFSNFRVASSARVICRKAGQANRRRETRSAYQRYDPRLRNLVAVLADIRPFVARGVPESTARQWAKDGPRDFFTLPELELSAEDLVQENIALKAQLAAADVKTELVLQTVRIFGFQVQFQRLPRAEAKVEINDAIKRAV